MSQILTAPGVKPGLFTPENPGAPEAAPGLVISAIFPPTVETSPEPTDFLGDLVRETFNFPSGQMLDAAAGQFPRYGWQIISRWDEMAALETVDIGGGNVTRGRRGDWFEYRDVDEGPQSRIEIGPGLVRVSKTDWNRHGKAVERQKENALQRQLWEEKQLMRPMALADFDFDLGGTRAEICAWSAKSRARLIATICELDLSALISGDRLPCMVTLTAPGDWLAVFPTAAVAAKKFDNFIRAWEKKWGPQSFIWKREFQGRFTAPRTLQGLDSGRAPHWHLWLVPPVAMAHMKAFREWLSLAWTTALQIADPDERANSLSAGTGVDFAEGLRARDPKRLAIYFLKESLGGEGKAYQNSAPPEWAGQSVGRFWGYRGLKKALAVVPVGGEVAEQVARTIRRYQRSAGTTEILRTLDGKSHETRVRVTREVLVQRVQPRTGNVRLWKTRRPARVMGPAGWVAVNNGATFGARLGAWASQLTAPGYVPVAPGVAPWHKPLDAAPWRGTGQTKAERLAELRRKKPAGSRAPKKASRSIPADPPWLCHLPSDHPVMELQYI